LPSRHARPLRGAGTAAVAITPKTRDAARSIELKLDVIAKPRSLVASGSTISCALLKLAARAASAPSALQVTIR
jgi:hypothetical protein